MVVHILAVAVGLGSIMLYLAAFFFPEVHRKHDFFWSGVGCFYALVLWVDAGQISTTEVIGHVAGIAMVLWFGWQTLQLRRKRTPRDLQTPLTDQSWQTFGKEISSLGLAWLKRTPVGRILPLSESDSPGQMVNLEDVRVSNLKQVDYEFVDDVAPSKAVYSAHQSPLHRGQNSVVTNSSTAASSVQRREREALPQKQEPAGLQHGTQTSKAEILSFKKPATWVEKGIVLKDWLMEVVATAMKPKPKKPVIIIPPREADISASSQANSTRITRPNPPSPEKNPLVDEERATVDRSGRDQDATVQNASGTVPETSPMPELALEDDNWSAIEREDNNWSAIASGTSSAKADAAPEADLHQEIRSKDQESQSDMPPPG
jgi:hypothetical protein